MSQGVAAGCVASCVHCPPSGKEDVGKPRGLSKQAGISRSAACSCPDLSVFWEKFTLSLESSGAFSSPASTIKCRVEGKHNTSPSSWAAIHPRVTEISLQSHQGWG